MYSGGLYPAGEYETYYFLPSGKMYTGWRKIDGNWYYFQDSGKLLQSGWVKTGENTYFVYDYVMLTNTWVQNKYCGSNGAILRNTTRTIGGTTYTFDSYGSPNPFHYNHYYDMIRF